MRTISMCVCVCVCVCVRERVVVGGVIRNSACGIKMLVYGCVALWIFDNESAALKAHAYWDVICEIEYIHNKGGGLDRTEQVELNQTKGCSNDSVRCGF